MGDANFGKNIIAKPPKDEDREMERLMETTELPTPAKLARTRILPVW